MSIEIINDIINKLRSMIKIGFTSNIMKDDADFPHVQTRFLGKKNNIWHVTPYGLFSSPPLNSIGLVFNIQSQEQNRAGIINDFKNRFKGLKQGEVTIGNTITRSRIEFRENGEVFIINAITGDSILLKANNTVVIDSPLVIFTNDIDVKGDIRPKDSSNVDIRDIFDAHVHSGIQSGPSNTNVPTTGQ